MEGGEEGGDTKMGCNGRTGLYGGRYAKMGCKGGRGVYGGIDMKKQWKEDDNFFHNKVHTNFIPCMY